MFESKNHGKWGKLWNMGWGWEKSKPESQSIATFWDKTYELGFTTNKRHSTSLSYSQIYDQHLKSHLAPFALATYRTSDASKYITGLAKKGYGRNTISHVRSLMSGLFSHAVNLGLIDSNPLIGAKSLSKWTCINIRIA